MTDAQAIDALADALRETRAALLVVCSPAIDRQLTPERRLKAHNAIELAAGVLLGLEAHREGFGGV